ncbi:MAG TPA: hypothetical protein VN442_01625 [Bryobacteraceae bacterium]|nr:hypothetical protein [Bryobacteraceae bacterium]
MYACLYAPEHAAAAVACAQAFSPRVEETAGGIVTLEIDGLERLFGGAHEIAAAIARRAADTRIRANIAIAGNPDAAICAARGFAGISIVPAGDEAKFLGTLPLAALDPPPEVAETLARWGIRRFRELAALPERGLVERLGPEGVRLHRLARGEFERPLVPLEEPLEFAEELELEHPVEQLEPLSFLLARLLNGLITRLGSRALATNELRLFLTLEDGKPHERTLRMPVPMLDGRAFLKLMQLDLEGHPPGAAIVRVRIEAVPVKPRAAHAGLFIPLAPEPEKLEVTLARLGALAGEGNVGTPELLDTHRPDAFRMRHFGEARNGAAVAAAGPRMALRVFRPARPARVEVVRGRLAHVSADGVRGSVETLAGPWRTTGDWWTQTPWARDEWDVELSGGALYRLVWEHATGRWFVEGSYD